MPVVGSGVMLAEKEVPQGPTQAVKCLLPNVQPAFTVAWSYGGSFSPAGCPDKCKLMSGSGIPFLYFLGVWQSSQPVLITRCSPFFSISSGLNSAFSVL